MYKLQTSDPAMIGSYQSDRHQRSDREEALPSALRVEPAQAIVLRGAEITTRLQVIHTMTKEQLTQLLIIEAEEMRIIASLIAHMSNEPVPRIVRIVTPATKNSLYEAAHNLKCGPPKFTSDKHGPEHSPCFMTTVTFNNRSSFAIAPTKN
jgi:hypothetical protein